MKLDEKRDIIQRSAEKAWINANYIGGFCITTGVGKAIAALHCTQHIPLGGTILFLAETTSRFEDIQKDLINYKNFFGIDILKNYKWIESTYQSSYKWNNKSFDLVIADEYHFAMTPIYSKFFLNNKYNKLVGLSATLEDNIIYNENDINSFTKKDLINKICPVIYTYNIGNSNKDGTTRKKIIFVINHQLNNSILDYTGGTKEKSFLQTEQSAYNYYNDRFKKSLFMDEGPSKTFAIMNASSKRAKVLYDANSKIKETKKLLLGLSSKTLVYGNSLDALYKITPNTISSRFSKEKNDKIRKSFETNEIDVLGSFKKLEQGANLKGLDNVIIHSYYSKTRPIIQRLGRIRLEDDKDMGFVFIFKTINTQEEKWFEKMMVDLKEFNIIYCKNVEEALLNYNN